VRCLNDYNDPVLQKFLESDEVEISSVQGNHAAHHSKRQDPTTTKLLVLDMDQQKLNNDKQSTDRGLTEKSHNNINPVKEEFQLALERSNTIGVPNNLEAGAMNTNSMESKSKGVLEHGEQEECPERITPLKHFKDLEHFDDFRENEPILRVATSNKLKSQVTSKRLSPKMTLKYKVRDSERASQIKIESNLSKVMRENSSVHPRESNNNFEYSLYSARAPCNPPANLHSVPPAQEQKLEHLRLKVKNHN
jgi:hypothetical protein